MSHRIPRSVALVLLLLLTVTAAVEAVSWPSESDWNKALSKNWEPLTDPSGDANKDFIDFQEYPRTDGSAFYWYYDGTNLFFRLTLNGDPVKQGKALQPFGWNVFVESTGDEFADYTVSLDGTGGANEIHTMYNMTLDNNMDGETGYSQAATQNPYTDVDGYIYLIDGYVRSKTITSGADTIGYLEFYVPLTWFSVVGGTGPAAVSPETRVKFAAGTGTSGQTINKDLVDPTGAVDVANYYLNTAAETIPSNSGEYGVLLDTGTGQWETGQTVTVSGYGWPPSTSTIYSSTLNVRILAPDTTQVWSGTVNVAADGSVTPTNTWQVQGTSSGVFTLQVEDPLNPGTYVSKDTFSAISYADLTSSNIVASQPTALRGDTLSYTITVTNAGGQPTTPTVTASIPAGTAYVVGSTTLDGSSLPDINGETPLAGGYTLPELTPGESAVLQFQVTVNTTATDQDVITSTATISDATHNLNRQTTTVVQVPIVTIYKSCNTANPAPGETLTFTTIAENGGHAAAVGLTVVETVPETVEYVSPSTNGPVGATITYQHVSGGAWDSSDAGTVVAIKWSLASLAPLTSATLTYQVLVP